MKPVLSVLGVVILLGVFAFIPAVSRAACAPGTCTWTFNFTDVLNQFGIKGCSPDNLTGCGLGIVDGLITIGTIVLVILIIWSGIEMLIMGASGQSIETSKRRFWNGIAGFVLLLLAKALFGIITFLIGPK